VEVHEYAFNPVDLALTLLDAVSDRGGQVHWSAPVELVKAETAGLRVDAGGGGEVFDWVVNCAARWSQHVRVSWRTQPLLDLAQQQWPVMVARASDLPTLERVLVNCLDGDNASVVPHGAWITLDYKSPAGPLDDERELVEARAPRPVELPDQFFEVCRRAFPPLAGLQRAYAFDGVQGRLRGAKPGSVGAAHVDPTQPRYLVAHGGQASTALLDALELVEALWTAGAIEEDPATLLHRLRGSTPKASHVEAQMAWDMYV
jgi:hypothetical protein